MSALGAATVTAVVQLVVMVALAPLFIGVVRTVHARLEGRLGGGVLQPWRDLRKQLRRAPVRVDIGRGVARVAPLISTATGLALCLMLPLVSRQTLLPADLFVVVSLLLVAAIAPALVGLAGGTAFGGMGSGRHLIVLALVEPTLLLAIYALSLPTGSSNLSMILSARLAHPSLIVSPVGLLALAALIIAIVAEGSRLPVDNPSTHLELTMIHEAMLIESSGRDLAWLELGAQLKLVALVALVGNLILPWGVAGGAGEGWLPASLLIGVVTVVARTLALGVVLAVVEVALAKVRLFRVPELLAGSVVLAFLAITISAVLPR